MMGSLSIIVAHHMYAMPPYPHIATDYATFFIHTSYVDSGSVDWCGSCRNFHGS
jgi:hypothetical protein